MVLAQELTFPTVWTRQPTLTQDRGPLPETPSRRCQLCTGQQLVTRPVSSEISLAPLFTLAVSP